MEHADIMMINHDLFKKMKDLAEKQEKLVFDENMDEFNVLMNQREQLRKDITANTRKYGKSMMSSKDKTGDQKVIEITSEIEDLIISIQEIDKRTEVLITSKKEAFQDEITNIRKGRTALRSYGGVRQRTTRFMDRKG